MSTTDALPFAVFDEFGKGADDRVQDHVRAALAAQAEKHAAELAGLEAVRAEQAAGREYWCNEADALRKRLDDWLYANGPNGWIDALRAERDALRAERDALFKAGIETAAALAQCKPLRSLSHLEDATHIGHRQFAAAYEKAEDDTKLMAIALRTALDAARTGGKG